MRRERSNGPPERRRIGPGGSIDRWDPAAGGAVQASRSSRAPAPRRLRTILVPLDGTPVAEQALPYALALARRSGAEVALAHVYSTLQAANEPALLGWHDGEYLVGPCRDYLEALTGRLGEASPIRIRPLLLRGYWPDDALCETADWEADLVVMAARRHGWWSRFWRGSVSAGVVRRSRVPVLLVPGREEGPVTTSEPPLARVLVPLDGSGRWEQALGPAVALAALSNNGQCDLLHVVRSRPYAVDWSLAYGPPAPPSLEPKWDSHHYLRGVAERLRAAAGPIRWRVVSDERPVADAIARYAELSGAEVVAVASRGRGAVSQLFRGSVAEAVARRAGVPVLLTRAGAPA